MTKELSIETVSNFINTLSRKKWHFSIPIGKILLAIVPAYVLLFFYKTGLFLLNTYFPNFAIETRHLVRLNLGFVYNQTFGTSLMAFIFFMILTLVVLSSLNKKQI